MNFGYLVVILAIVLVSTVLHELAHGGVAYLLGDTTAKEEGRLSLNPVRHIDPVMSVLVPVMLYLIGGPVFGGAKPVPVDSRNLKGREWGMALVAIAGPLTNLLLAFFGFMIWRFTGVIYTGGFWSFVLQEVTFINLGFMIFNLIPFPPLDGSRVLYAIAPDGVRRFMEYLETYGVWIVLALVWVFGNYLSQFMVSAMNGILDGFIFLTGGALT